MSLLKGEQCIHVLSTVIHCTSPLDSKLFVCYACLPIILESPSLLPRPLPPHTPLGIRLGSFGNLTGFFDVNMLKGGMSTLTFITLRWLLLPYLAWLHCCKIECYILQRDAIFWIYGQWCCITVSSCGHSVSVDVVVHHFWFRFGAIIFMGAWESVI